MIVVDVLRDFEFETDSSVTLQVQLYQALKSRILTGRLTASTRIPSSRQFASSLSVSRNTVNGALEQLKAEGYIKTKQGAGHYVSDELPESFLLVHKKPDVSLLSKTVNAKGLGVSGFGCTVLGELVSDEVSNDLPIGVERVERSEVKNTSFEAGVPDLKAFPIKKWGQITSDNLRIALMGYDSPQGYEPLRRVLADYLRSSRGLECSLDQVIITVGAQQASSIALHVLLNEGDTAYVENPGYIGMRKAIAARGANVQGIDVGEEGIDITQLPSNPTGKLICLTPTHQYPMGGIVPLGNRLRILQWAATHGIWVVEDDYDSEYHYDHKPIAAMQGLGLKEQVIYIGSFSKVLFPALRLGYMVVPKRLVKACVAAKTYMSGQSPIIDQATTAEFIQSGLFLRHLHRMRLLYEKKLQAILEACNKHLSNVAIPIYSGAGMHIVLTFKSAVLKGVNDKDVVHAMNKLQIYGSALSSYYVNTPKYQGLVLGFANTDVSKMDGGIDKIGQAIDNVF
ncbi:hypothetical protein A9Q81_09995 [Gammaproteobacteria bacterium 42_54_T18]|nr:hypothetical protein A9Q81_09995 [Gammaproteobacteria bacterium 42_54_T18]